MQITALAEVSIVPRIEALRHTGWKRTFERNHLGTEATKSHGISRASLSNIGSDLACKVRLHQR